MFSVQLGWRTPKQAGHTASVDTVATADDVSTVSCSGIAHQNSNTKTQDEIGEKPNSSGMGSQLQVAADGTTALDKKKKNHPRDSRWEECCSTRDKFYHARSRAISAGQKSRIVADDLALRWSLMIKHYHRIEQCSSRRESWGMVFFFVQGSSLTEKKIPFGSIGTWTQTLRNHGHRSTVWGVVWKCWKSGLVSQKYFTSLTPNAQLNRSEVGCLLVVVSWRIKLSAFLPGEDNASTLTLSAVCSWICCPWKPSMNMKAIDLLPGFSTLSNTLAGDAFVNFEFLLPILPVTASVHPGGLKVWADRYKYMYHVYVDHQMTRTNFTALYCPSTFPLSV